MEFSQPQNQVSQLLGPFRSMSPKAKSNARLKLLKRQIELLRPGEDAGDSVLPWLTDHSVVAVCKENIAEFSIEKY